MTMPLGAAWVAWLVVTSSALTAAAQAKPLEQPPPTKPAAAQAKPPEQPPPTKKAVATPAAKPAAVPQPAPRGALELAVTDASGNPVQDGRVTMTGPVSREGTTGKDGTLTFVTLRPGGYRVRVEASDFITLERDVTIRAGAPNTADMMLNRAPVKVPPPRAPRPRLRRRLR